MDGYLHQITSCNESGKLTTEGTAIFDLHPECHIKLSDHLYLGYNLRQGSHAETYLKMQIHSKFIVNGCFKVFYGASIELFPGAVLTVGKSYINSQCLISCAKQITIGNDVAIARRVMLYDSDHHCIVDPAGMQQNSAKPIVIKDHVWIGVGAIILKGVTLEEGCIVGAGAVVTHDVPAGCIAAGNPARIIRNNVEWR